MVKLPEWQNQSLDFSFPRRWTYYMGQIRGTHPALS